jgi:hypothetical protein
MARPRKGTDLRAQVLKRYEELVKERNEIDGELQAIQVYLRSVGGVTAPARGRKAKKSAAPAKRGSATQSIISLIGRHGEGISIDQIMKATGLARLTVNGVLNRLKKEKKVKAIKRGVYVKA